MRNVKNGYSERKGPIPVLSPDYIVGLVDGEGSFSVFAVDKKQSKEKYRRMRLVPSFFIKLRIQEKSLLEAVKRFFQVGKVYFQKEKRKNHSACYRYDVHSIDELWNAIIPFFRDRMPKSIARKDDFEIFSKIVEKIFKKEHLTRRGFSEILKLKKRMHKFKTRTGTRPMREIRSSGGEVTY